MVGNSVTLALVLMVASGLNLVSGLVVYTRLAVGTVRVRHSDNAVQLLLVPVSTVAVMLGLQRGLPMNDVTRIIVNLNGDDLCLGNHTSATGRPSTTREPTTRSTVQDRKSVV